MPTATPARRSRGYGAAFNGFEVAPLGLEGTRKLVYAAMFAGLFPSNSTVPACGAGLYGFCRAQTAVWKSLALTSEQACGSVHDAFAATELIGASAAAMDVSIAVEAEGDDDGTIAAKIRVYNGGTARCQSRERRAVDATEHVHAVDERDLLHAIAAA